MVLLEVGYARNVYVLTWFFPRMTYSLPSIPRNKCTKSDLSDPSKVYKLLYLTFFISYIHHFYVTFMKAAFCETSNYATL